MKVWNDPNSRIFHNNIESKNKINQNKNIIKSPIHFVRLDDLKPKFSKKRN